MIDFLKTYSSSPIKRQILLSYFLKGASISISLMYVPLMLTYLSPAQFGLWVAIASIINWLKLLDIGIGNGLRFHLASALAVGDHQKARQLVSTTYAIIGGIFIGVWLLLMTLIPHVDWQSLLNSDLISRAEYNKIMYIAITAIVSTFILDLVKIIYASHGNTAVGNIFQLAGSSVSLVGIWFLSIFTNQGQLDLAVMVVAFSPVIVYLFANLYTYGIKFKSLLPKASFIQMKNSKDLFNLSLKFFVVQITATIIFASLPFVITRFYGPESVAQYHVANSIFNLPVMIIGLFTAPLIPFVTREFAKDNLSWVRASLKKAMILSLMVCLGTAVLIFLSPFIYKIWLGDKIEVPFNLSAFIGIYTMINVLVNPLSSFMNGIGKINILVWLAPISIGMFIGGCFLFDYLLHDLIAIVLALSLTSIVGLLVEPLVLRKHLKIKI